MPRPKVASIFVKVGSELVEMKVTTEKEGFSASFPKYKGCYTQGSSLPHLVEMAKEVVPFFQAPLPDWKNDPEVKRLNDAVRKELGLTPAKTSPKKGRVKA